MEGEEAIPQAVIDWLTDLHNRSEAKHGEVAVYRYTVDGVKYTARILRTDPNHTIL